MDNNPSKCRALTPNAPARRLSTTVRRQRLFLEGFSKTGTITGACRHAGVTRAAADHWRLTDPIFSEQFEEVNLEIAEVLESRGLAEAMSGNADLIKFFLRARRPDIYRESHTIRSTTVAASVPLDLAAITQDQLDAIIEALEASP